MHFQHHIFISYAHIDDQSLREGEPGWISQFHRALEVRVSQLLGKKPRIWRDPKLQGNDLFGDELLSRLPEAALLISILSPRYVRSEWCTREVAEFYRASEQSGGARVANQMRIFKVVKTPVPLEKHPAEIQEVLGYDFFASDPETGRAHELEQTPGLDTERLYWAKLDDLAYDICDMLQSLGADQSTTTRLALPLHQLRTIYVARSTFDLEEEHDAIRRHLKRQGHTVLPDRQLPLVYSRFDAAVRRDLAQCQMSIHLVGREYGLVPDGARKSAPVLQNELAMERAADGELLRLLWLPPDLQIEDERQREFVDRLRNDAGMLRGADLLETPFEDLKTVIQQKLHPPEKAAEPPPGQIAAVEGEEFLSLYLICDQRDAESTSVLEDCLFDQGFEVILPAFEGEEAQIREDHEENLRSCDAVLIFYGQGNDLWLRKQLRELKKCAALGRSGPLLAKGIYVAPPETPRKARLRTHEATVLHQENGFAPEVLQPFLAQIEQRQGGSGLPESAE